MWLLLLGVPADDVGAALLAVFPATIVPAGESVGHALLAVALVVLVRATPSAAYFAVFPEYRRNKICARNLGPSKNFESIYYILDY